jgi:nicotinate-nucleotide pyrophosphorylase (carboxylating)
VPEKRQATGFIVAREAGVLSGGEVALEVLRKVDPAIDATLLVDDGDRIAEGAYLMKLEGPARSLLTAERTTLNFMQRMSGVASATRRYVDEVRGTSAQILDTRKTIPGWRLLDKRAVVHGGGVNHRMGLYDRVMVKDNHLVAEGRVEALQEAIRRLKSDHPAVEVELEADRLEQVTAFLELDGVDYLLLDNMSHEELRRAVELRGERTRPRLEASGGVSLETVAGIAETGVDFISVGAITHSVKALDLALDFVNRE